MKTSHKSLILITALLAASSYSFADDNFSLSEAIHPTLAGQVQRMQHQIDEQRQKIQEMQQQQLVMVQNQNLLITQLLDMDNRVQQLERQQHAPGLHPRK